MMNKEKVIKEFEKNRDWDLINELTEHFSEERYNELIEAIDNLCRGIIEETEKQAKQELRQEVINQINMGLSLDLIKKNLEKELKQEVNDE